MISVCIVYIICILYMCIYLYITTIYHVLRNPRSFRVQLGVFGGCTWCWTKCCQHRIEKELLRLSGYTIANFHCHMPPLISNKYGIFCHSIGLASTQSGLNFIIPINFASQVTHRKAPFLTRICCKMLLQTFNMLHWWYSEIENDESDANANGYQTYDRIRALYLFSRLCSQISSPIEWFKVCVEACSG